MPSQNALLPHFIFSLNPLLIKHPFKSSLVLTVGKNGTKSNVVSMGRRVGVLGDNTGFRGKLFIPKIIHRDYNTGPDRPDLAGINMLTLKGLFICLFTCLFIYSIVDLFIVYTHACVFMHACIPGCICGGQKTSCWFPPSAMWDLGIKLKLSGLALDTFTC